MNRNAPLETKNNNSKKALISFSVLLFLLAFTFLISKSPLTEKVAAGTCDNTECAEGETTTWSCNTGGCPVGTRRQCECVPPGVVGFFWCWGNCQCISDPSCSGGSCTEGATGGCGSNGCGSSQKSVCSGGAWSCYDDATCGGFDKCVWQRDDPPGCAHPGDYIPYRRGTCVGGDNDGDPAGCTYDTACPGGYCDIPPNHICCSGLAENLGGSGCDCPVCTPTNPTKPQPLLSPSNGHFEQTNDVFVDWTNVNNWGTGCPNTNTYKARYTPKAGATCPAQNSGYTNKNLGGTSETTLYDLNWGTTYCWYARAANGDAARNSDETWEFTTPDTASLDDLQISTAGSCGNSVSGNANIANVDNPITIMTEYSLDDNGVGVEDIDEVLLAIVPDDVRNAAIVSENSIARVSDRYFMAKATINSVTPALSEFSIVDLTSYPYYGGSTSTGELNNSFGAGSLLNINSAGANATHVEIVDANTVRVYWQIRFDDNYKYQLDDSLYASIINGNVYTAGLRELIPGVWNSSTGSNTIDRSLSLESNWGVNVQIPQVSIGSAEVLTNSRFRVNWDVSGYGLTQVDGYMWGNQPGYQLERVSPNGAILNIPTTEPADFSPSNVGVGIGVGKTLGNQRYETLTSQSVILQTKMSANDSACNQVTDSGPSLNLSDGWLMTVGGNAFAKNFNTTVNQSNLTGDLSYLNDYSYLSTYLSSIEQDTFGTSSRISKNNYALSGYNDWNENPVKNVDFTSWSDYIESLVEDKSTIYDVNATTMASGKKTEQWIEAKTGITLNNNNYTAHVKINNDFTIAGANKCNTKTIFFINGDLTINPNFRIENRTVITGGNGVSGLGSGTTYLQTGCLFVVKGNVTVGSGAYKNYYDKIDAFFIVKGQFITNEDDGGNPANARYDGLYIKGSVIASELLLGRNLKLLNNLDQPSEIIEYDPRYSNLFFDELKIDEFSIREKNYQKNLYD